MWRTTRTLARELKKEQNARKETFLEIQTESQKFYELLAHKISDTEDKINIVLKNQTEFHRKCDSIFERLFSKLYYLEMRISESSQSSLDEIGKTEKVIETYADKSVGLMNLNHKKMLSNIEKFTSEIITSLQITSEIIKSEFGNLQEKSMPEMYNSITEYIKSGDEKQRRTIEDLKTLQKEVGIDVTGKLATLQAEILDEDRRLMGKLEKMILKSGDEVSSLVGIGHEEVLGKIVKFGNEIVGLQQTDSEATKNGLELIQKDVLPEMQGIITESIKSIEKEQVKYLKELKEGVAGVNSMVDSGYEKISENNVNIWKEVITSLQMNNEMIRNEFENIQKEIVPKVQGYIADYISNNRKDQIIILEELKEKNRENRIETGELKTEILQIMNNFFSALDFVKENENAVASNIEAMNHTLQEVVDGIMALDEGNRLVIAKMLLNDLGD